MTQKIHSIIEKTAKFISIQGQQMEIVIKTKQKLNPYFSFLIPEDRLYRYYQWLLHAMSTGTYPGAVMEGKSEIRPGACDDNRLAENRETDGQIGKGEGTDRTGQSGERVTQVAEEEQSDSDSDSDDEGFELHPLLRASLTSKKPASTPSVKQIEKEKPVSASSSIGSFVSPVSSKAFRHIALSMNSASTVVPSARSSGGGQPHSHGLAVIFFCHTHFPIITML